MLLRCYGTQPPGEHNGNNGQQHSQTQTQGILVDAHVTSVHLSLQAQNIINSKNSCSWQNKQEKHKGFRLANSDVLLMTTASAQNNEIAASKLAGHHISAFISERDTISFTYTVCSVCLILTHCVCVCVVQQNYSTVFI